MFFWKEISDVVRRICWRYFFSLGIIVSSAPTTTGITLAFTRKPETEATVRKRFTQKKFPSQPFGWQGSSLVVLRNVPFWIKRDLWCWSLLFQLKLTVANAPINAVILVFTFQIFSTLSFNPWYFSNFLYFFFTSAVSASSFLCLPYNASCTPDDWPKYFARFWKTISWTFAIIII